MDIGIYGRWISSVGVVHGMVVAIASVFIGVDGAVAFSNAAPEATQFQRQKKTPATMLEGVGMQKRVTVCVVVCNRCRALTRPLA